MITGRCLKNDLYQMRYGIFADIHSNLEAFEAVLEALASEQIEQYLCVGDIVGYGANPKECIHRLKQLNSITICGNHDWASVGLFDISYFNPHAKQAVLWTEQQLSDEDKEFLKSLKLIHTEEIFTPLEMSKKPTDTAKFLTGFTLVHGTLNNPEEFRYIYDAYTARETLELTNTNICFVAHSHIPLVILKEQNDKTSYPAPFCRAKRCGIKISSEVVYVINVGSVGQPRDGDPRACFCIYDSESKMIEIKRIEYNVKEAQNKIIRASLPEILVWRLAEG